MESTYVSSLEYSKLFSVLIKNNNCDYIEKKNYAISVQVGSNNLHKGYVIDFDILKDVISKIIIDLDNKIVEHEGFQLLEAIFLLFENHFRKDYSNILENHLKLEVMLSIKEGSEEYIVRKYIAS